MFFFFAYAVIQDGCYRAKCISSDQNTVGERRNKISMKKKNFHLLPKQQTNHQKKKKKKEKNVEKIGRKEGEKKTDKEEQQQHQKKKQKKNQLCYKRLTAAERGGPRRNQTLVKQKNVAGE